MQQTIKAMIEAERHKGPSLVIAYSTCVAHGIKEGMGSSIAQQKKAVESGYWHLYRYNPELKEKGENPFIMDSKEPKGNFLEFLESEIRYSSLKNIFPDIADEMFQVAKDHAHTRYEKYRRMAENDCN